MENQLGKFISVCMLLVGLSTTACEREPYPTLFEGRVFMTETGDLLQDSYLYVTGHADIGFNNYPITIDTVFLGMNGDFRLLVPFQEKLRSFTINVMRDNTLGTEVLSMSQLDCSPYRCGGFQAGKSYKFDIRVSDPD